MTTTDVLSEGRTLIENEKVRGMQNTLKMDFGS